MEWPIAQIKIQRSIKLGTDLNTPNSTYRYVLSTNATIKSVRYGYKSESGFIVTIGKTSSISIPWGMLKQCFFQLQSLQGYDGKYFRERFPIQAQDHPCHVHVIGQIFVVAEIAYLDGNKYRILKN